MGTCRGSGTAAMSAGSGTITISERTSAPRLDGNMIRRANEASVTDTGDSTARAYQRNLEAIDSYTSLSAEERQSAIQKLYDLTTHQLEQEARTENPYATGRGVGRFDRQSMRAAGEGAINARLNVEQHMREVREKNNSNAQKAHQKALLEAATTAMKNGALEYTVNGVTYRRKSKRAKTFERVYE